MESQQRPYFKTIDDAFAWMEEDCNEECMDNYRFAFDDDHKAVLAYEDRQQEGCCGFYDVHICVDGRDAMIGCNYGH